MQNDAVFVGGGGAGYADPRHLLLRYGNRHGLITGATGTGKTVMAALDYQRLRNRLPRARLLFVAHRREILEQSLATFRHALRDAAFGELWVGGDRPDRRSGQTIG